MNVPAVWKAVQIPFEAIFSKSEDVTCVALTDQQIAALLSQTQYLHWLTRWSSETPLTDLQKLQIKALASSTEAALLSICGDERCYDFEPSSDMVGFEPQNPYTEPELVPEGYADVPFTIVKTTDSGLLALGLDVGDVITDITRFPTGSLPTVIPPGGFARFRVTFIGNEIELHLLQLPAGGIVAISYDDDPLTLATLDLNKDIFSLPVETVSVITHQIKFPSTEEHHVDVTFVPWINDEFPFLNYGGGIRGFTVCGAFSGVDEMDVRQNEETPCILEKTIDGENWVQFADLRKCPPRLRRNPGTGAWQLSDDGLTWFDVDEGPWVDGITEPATIPPPPPRAGGTAVSRRCDAAANAENVIHSTFNEMSDSINATGSTATDVALAVAAILGVLLFMTAWAWVPIVAIASAFIIANVQFNRDEYTSTVSDELRCVLFCNASDDDGVVTFDMAGVNAGIVDLLASVPWPAIQQILNIIGEDGLNRAGGTTAITGASCECDECPDDNVACDFVESFEDLTGVTILEGFQDGEAIRGATTTSGGLTLNFLTVKVDFPPCSTSRLTIKCTRGQSFTNVLSLEITLKRNGVETYHTLGDFAGSSSFVEYTHDQALGGTHPADEITIRLGYGTSAGGTKTILLSEMRLWYYP